MTDLVRTAFRMKRLQVFNWGTFSDVHDIPIADRGFLFVGPSGAGKSTLLDALSALLVPPKWTDFNAAAREADKSGRDRNVLSYVRGAWAEQKDGGSGDIVTRYLRKATTWSALALTYADGEGQHVTLVQLFWVRGATTANTDVHRHYLIFERAFDLKELSGFDLNLRKLKLSFPEAFERGEFRPYCERFRRLLGIDSEMALRLLHKTQSAKNLGDLNALLRDFMLDTPETFEVADRLVNEFAELNAAHQAVVTAREQVQALTPAREHCYNLAELRDRRRHVQELARAIDPYREMRLSKLLEERIASLAILSEGYDAKAKQQEELVGQYRSAIRELERQHSDLGGARIEQWQDDKQAAESQRDERLRRRAAAEQACGRLETILPTTPQGFAERVGAARIELEQWPHQREEIRAMQLELQGQLNRAQEECAAAVREVKSLERRPSNIPAYMQDLRTALAQALGLSEAELPFAGELIEVDPAHAEWRGALERVLRGFALSVLVSERHYPAFSNHVNAVRLPDRLVYHRVVRTDATPARVVAGNSLVHKLQVKQDEHGAWLHAELRQRFDYACVDTMQAFRNAERAVTREGHVRHGKTRHEKDDRSDLRDPRQWVLGFDNREKLERFTRQAHELAGRIHTLNGELKILAEEERRRDERAMACQTLADLTWQEIDVAPALARIHFLTQQIEAALAGNAALKQLSEQIGKQTRAMQTAEQARDEAAAGKRDVDGEIGKCQRKLAPLVARLNVALLLPQHAHDLNERIAAAAKPMTLDNIDEQCRDVERALGKESETIGTACADLERAIERIFTVFKGRWPLEAGDMDTTLASAPDFLARLQRLETDGLPAHEQRFFDLLQNQSNQNLAALAKHLGYARDTIIERMEQVNDSLSHAQFNPGSYLRIEVTDRQLQEVREFKQEIQQVLLHAWTDDREEAETRFKVLRQLVERLASADPEQRRWRESVLDVRLHVEFIGREVDEQGQELEVYRSGTGKSGGQRQKLATTCLAAALRYQLGNSEGGGPTYAAVVLDEAFDKADNDFTTLAMNIFVQFGFQMVVATPLKSVMTLEPFIGGACFVEIRERCRSAVLMIEYDDERQRLRLPQGVHEEAPFEVS